MGYCFDLHAGKDIAVTQGGLAAHGRACSAYRILNNGQPVGILSGRVGNNCWPGPNTPMPGPCSPGIGLLLLRGRLHRLRCLFIGGLQRLCEHSQRVI